MKTTIFFLATLLTVQTVQAECHESLNKWTKWYQANVTLGLDLALKDAQMAQYRAEWDKQIAQTKNNLVQAAMKARIETYEKIVDTHSENKENRQREHQLITVILDSYSGILDVVSRHVQFRNSFLYKGMALLGLAKSESQIDDQVEGALMMLQDTADQAAQSILDKSMMNPQSAAVTLNVLFDESFKKSFDDSMMMASLEEVDALANALLAARTSLLELQATLHQDIQNIELRAKSSLVNLCTLTSEANGRCQNLELKKQLEVFTQAEYDEAVAIRKKHQEEAAAAAARARAQEEERRRKAKPPRDFEGGRRL